MFPMKNVNDIESGLYPNMMESPQLRWAFIRKVYAIICIQFLVTFVVAASMFFTPSVTTFIRTWPLGFVTMICVIIFTIGSLLAMNIWIRNHPWNYILMFMFTVAMSFLVGCSCAYKKGEIVLTAAGLTFLVTVTLTLYTFWAAKKGYDFQFLFPFLFSALIILFAFSILRMFFPMGGTFSLIFGCIGALVFSGFIIYDTDNLIKRFSYDDYLMAAITLYLDIINLFLAILGIMDSSD